MGYIPPGAAAMVRILRRTADRMNAAAPNCVAKQAFKFAWQNHRVRIRRAPRLSALSICTRIVSLPVGWPRNGSLLAQYGGARSD